MTKRKRDDEHQNELQVKVLNTPSSSTSEEIPNEDNDPLTITANIQRRKSHRISLKRSVVNQSSKVEPNETITTEQQTASFSKQEESSNVSIPKQTSKEFEAAHSVQATSTHPVSNAQPKTLRKIQVWTEDDTRWFLEALCEHGKDFPSIQSYIAARCEKKGIPNELVKTYEQVRHYYYRMWHKISPMLSISNDVEKNVQELYGIINYGEIWKKFGTKLDSKLDSKLRDSLQHLVDSGHTVFKVKGKTVRVRTPVCNALKRLHNIDVKSVQKPQLLAHPIPKEILVEIIPATNSDWWHVQNLSQNPRLKTFLSMQHRLSSLIEYLERRWSLQRIKQIESNELFCENILSDSKFKIEYYIRLRPVDSMKLCEKVLLKNASINNTGGGGQVLVSDISLNAYLKNFCETNDAKARKLNKKKSKTLKKREAQEDVKHSKEASSEQDTQVRDDQPNGGQVEDILKMLDSMNEELEQTVIKPNKREMDKTDLLNPTTITSSSCRASHPTQEFKLPEPPSNATLAQWLAGETGEEEKSDSIKEGANKINLKGKKRRGSTSCSEEMVTLLTAEKAKVGWTLADSNSVSIGELYLLFGYPEKIVLEYHWVAESANDMKVEAETPTFLQKFLLAANLCLNNFTKKQTHSSVKDTTSLPASTTTSKPKRAPKNAATHFQPNAKSELLSDVIKETILLESCETSKKSNETFVKPTTPPKSILIKPRPAPASKATVAQIISDDQQNELDKELNNLKTHNQTRRQVRRFISRAPSYQALPTKPPSQIQLNNVGGGQKVYLQILTPEGQKKNIKLVQSASISIAAARDSCEVPSVSGSSVVIPIHVDAKELFSNSNLPKVTPIIQPSDGEQSSQTYFDQSIPFTSNKAPTIINQCQNYQSHQQVVSQTTETNIDLARDEDSFDIGQYANSDWLNDVQNISLSSLIGIPSTATGEEMQPNIDDIQISSLESELNFSKFAEQINQTINHN